MPLLRTTATIAAGSRGTGPEDAAEDRRHISGFGICFDLHDEISSDVLSFAANFFVRSHN
jgi:hypothetical protein